LFRKWEQERSSDWLRLTQYPDDRAELTPVAKDRLTVWRWSVLWRKSGGFAMIPLTIFLLLGYFALQSCKSTFIKTLKFLLSEQYSIMWGSTIIKEALCYKILHNCKKLMQVSWGHLRQAGLSHGVQHVGYIKYISIYNVFKLWCSLNL
jgi:hypothetical protein